MWSSKPCWNYFSPWEHFNNFDYTLSLTTSPVNLLKTILHIECLSDFFLLPLPLLHPLFCLHFLFILLYHLVSHLFYLLPKESLEEGDCTWMTKKEGRICLIRHLFLSLPFPLSPCFLYMLFEVWFLFFCAKGSLFRVKYSIDTSLVNFPVGVNSYIVTFKCLFTLFRVREEFTSGVEYWYLERKLCHALGSKQEVLIPYAEEIDLILTSFLYTIPFWSRFIGG